jgi:hypothetical protein
MDSGDQQDRKDGIVGPATAAAFALDVLYGVARGLIPAQEVDEAEECGEEEGGKRARHVADRLRRGVAPGRLAESWPERIRELYKMRERRRALRGTRRGSRVASRPPIERLTGGVRVATRGRGVRGRPHA